MSMSFKNSTHLGAVRKIAIICLGCAADHGDFSRQVEVVVADRKVILCKARQNARPILRSGVPIIAAQVFCRPQLEFPVGRYRFPPPETQRQAESSFCAILSVLLFGTA